MRVLVAMNFVAEGGEESYVATPVTKVVAAPIPEAAIVFWQELPNIKPQKGDAIS